MPLSNSLALLSTMFVLAIIPSPSVFAVIARSITSGFIHGVITTVGIVTGDFIFILLAMLGLWTLAETMASVFFLLKYLGSAYLIYLGIITWRSQPKAYVVEGIQDYSWISNFMGGLLITLSDPKAILFYAGFLPAYLDMSHLSVTAAGTILLSALLAVGSAKLLYAYLAARTRFLFSSTRLQKIINGLAAIAMVGTGIFLAVKA